MAEIYFMPYAEMQKIFCKVMNFRLHSKTKPQPQANNP